MSQCKPHKINATQSEFHLTSFWKVYKFNLKLMWKNKGLQMAKEILNIKS